MVVVRYAALVALVVWLGAMQTAMAVAGGGQHWLQYACGAVLVVTLFAMKFLGPPPRAFVTRIAVAVVMLGIAVVEHRYGTWLLVVNLCLGFISLIWYVRE